MASQTIIEVMPRQPGEKEGKPCNGEKHNGAWLPIEKFGVRKETDKRGNHYRKPLCIDCTRLYAMDLYRKNHGKGRKPATQKAASKACAKPSQKRAASHPMVLPVSTPATPEQIGVARQPGEPEMRRCNGPFCDGQHRPVEQFGVTKRKYRNGNYQRRLRCLACEGVTNREYEAKQQREGKEPAQEKRKKPPIAYTSTGKRISLAWLSKGAIILFDVDGTRYVENANKERVQHLRAAGVLPTPTDVRAWSRVCEGRAG